MKTIADKIEELNKRLKWQTAGALACGAIAFAAAADGIKELVAADENPKHKSSLSLVFAILGFAVSTPLTVVFYVAADRTQTKIEVLKFRGDQHASFKNTMS